MDTVESVIKPEVPVGAFTIDNDQNAILSCQKGNKQAYGFLVRKYMKRAYYTALGLVGSHENAVDLSQDAFIRAYRAIKKFDAEKNFFTWYYRILRNLCFNFLRDRARHARSFSEVGEKNINVLTDESQNTSVQVERNELRRAVWDALATIKKHDREIIILKDIQNFSYKEIAEILDCPIGTVMSRLYNARKALKAKLERFYA
ncbi:sigma-70 family RNA polymerase sigma factor [candidate division KSB1 bacterium]|nr:sigma-70 family RNA polymerase sigma factor [candidate division KSB1 bacterium]